MIHNPNAYRTMPVGVVLRRTPGVTRWAKWAWSASAVLPGAADVAWKEMRREGEAVEYHAATLPLELHGADTEAYLACLNADIPSLYVVLRRSEGEHPFEVLHVTASPFEAQDYTDSGEEQVEKVPMPHGLVAWVRDFIEAFHAEEDFVKRRRDRTRVDLQQDGVGDPRVGKAADIYASPALMRRRLS